MRRLLLRIALFSLPFFAYGAVVVVLDPYCFFNLTTFISPEIKRGIAFHNNYALWTVLYYDHQSGPNVLLGDSRMAMFDTAYIKTVSGMDYENLSMPGASSVEVVNLFWHIAKHHKLRNVDIGLNFDGLNQFMSRDQVNATVAVEANPLLYFTSRDVVLSSWQIVQKQFFGCKISSERPSVSKEEYWKEELDYRGTRRLYNFKFDEGLFSKFKEIASFCRKNRIRLRFIMLPMHDDAQQKIREFGLESDWRKFAGRLRALAETWDFDYPSAITANRENYLDPFHLTPQATHLVIDRVWAPNSLALTNSETGGH